jgi:hypothetical protein
MQCDHKRPTTDTQEKNTHEEQKRPMGAPEGKSHHSIPEWLIMVFTAVLALVGFFQYRTSDKQTTTSRISERAWLEIRPGNSDPSQRYTKDHRLAINAGEPVTFDTYMVNTGKTPAKNIHLYSFVDIFPAAVEVPLSNVDNPTRAIHQEVVSGMVLPDSPTDMARRRIGQDGTFIIATSDEVADYYGGKAYVAAYGMVTYEDVFHKPHWMKFCFWSAGLNGAISATRNCSNYNSMDENANNE